MSGHSKWSTIKRQKGATDARRGQLFTKLSRDIAIAVREGGGSDPDLNYRLRLAVDKAKGSNMPMDTIDRAISRAAGGGDSDEQLENLIYEGYGPGGTAIMLQALTPNRNRTASEVRSVFTKAGANLGEAGCVAWNFESRGVITLEVDENRVEDIVLLAIDALADDVKVDGGYLEIYTQPETLEAVRKELEHHEVNTSSAEISMMPMSTVSLGAKEAEQTLKLLDNLEDLMDVQKVYSNADFPDEVLEKYRSDG
ncbi:MAG: YebC/PmpR family DNA-binding transcriptional regulator [Dehalococcoidia bacterium]|nr:YebC/PmpR family DNA-binding transcriptional regulator [Dehalococcoidia bacterium]